MNTLKTHYNSNIVSIIGNRKSFLLFLIIVTIFINPPHSFSSTKSDNYPGSLEETIIALDVTRKKSHQELDKINNQQVPSPKEIKDHTVFINYLSHQINKYCSQIREQSTLEKKFENLPCNFNENQKSGVLHKPVKTSYEEIALLENELMNLFGDFDEMLLKEEEKLAQVSQNNHSNTSPGEGKGRNSSTEFESKENKSGKEPDLKKDSEKNDQSNTEKADTNKTDKESEKSSKGKQNKLSKINDKERRKLDKIDDDIVARQLKEAAEKESDPKLKEKLWEEYYKYKQKSL